MKTKANQVMMVSLLVWGVAYITARLLLELQGLGVGTRLLLSFGPTVPFLAFLWAAIRTSRDEDEMERRVQIEALAVGFGLTLLLVATLALAQRAGFAKDDDFSFGHILPMMFMFYLGGRIRAVRRYGCETA